MTAITDERRRRGGLAGIALLALLALAASCSVAVEVPASVEAASTSGPTPIPPSNDRTPAATETAEPAPEDEPQPEPDFEVSDAWPESVRDYVDFVQTTRGEQFTIIADVRFVDPEELLGEFRGEPITLADLPLESQVVIERLDDLYRALGLANEDFDILDADRAVLGQRSMTGRLARSYFPPTEVSRPMKFPLSLDRCWYTSLDTRCRSMTESSGRKISMIGS